MKTRIDGHELQKVKDHFSRLAQREVDLALADSVDLKEDDIKAIHSKHEFEAQMRIDKIFTLGPKELHRLGFALDKGSHRNGYTRPTAESKKASNRAKNKMARKSRKANRK